MTFKGLLQLRSFFVFGALFATLAEFFYFQFIWSVDLVFFSDIVLGFAFGANQSN